MKNWSWVAGALLLIVQPILAAAQPVVELGDSTACTCEIRATLRVTLRDEDGRGGLAAPMTMARLADGRFLVVPITQQDRILVFRADGVFEAQVGRSGQGPGEYLAVIKLEPTPGDSVLVLDPGNGRMTLLDPDLRQVRTAQIAIRAGQIESLSDGSVLLLAGLSAVGDPRLPRLHLLDRSFTLVRSFMQEGERSADGDPAGARRRMTATRAGTIAVAHTNEYVLEIWNAEGVHSETLVRVRERFIAADNSSGVAGAPRRAIGDPSFDSEGRLWTITYVADDTWQQGVRLIQGPTGPVLGPDPGTANDYQDTWVEVLDIERNVLLASRRLDPMLRFMLDGGFAASYREDESGNPFIDVWELELLEP